MAGRDRHTISVLLTAVLVAAVLILGQQAWAGEKGNGGISDDDIGLRKGSLFTEKDVKPAEGKYSKDAPGKSTRLERSFENSPPLIPHDISSMVPVKVTNNMCVACHMPRAAKMTGAVPVPVTHLTDLRTGKSLGGKLDGGRFNCLQCHVPQASLKLPVANDFKKEFRHKEGNFSSNLADVMDEGVK